MDDHVISSYLIGTKKSVVKKTVEILVGNKVIVGIKFSRQKVTFSHFLPTFFTDKVFPCEEIPCEVIPCEAWFDRLPQVVWLQTLKMFRNINSSLAHHVVISLRSCLTGLACRKHTHHLLRYHASGIQGYVFTRFICV